LDLKSGFWQAVLRPDGKKKTMFLKGLGLLHFTVVPFGFCNAAVIFEQIMEIVIRGLTYESCLVYLHNMIVIGCTFWELHNLQ
jgi:hypothetical protein